MTILDIVRKYYLDHSSDLNSFLEETIFLDTNSHYQNSVVIRFGKNKLIGEISVWEHETGSYLENMYGSESIEAVCIYEDVDINTVVKELVKQFENLRKLANNNQ